jgi:Zn-dependent peptidase ImmA (M78 family)
VSSTRELHDRAMNLFEGAVLARHADDETRMRSLLTEAMKFESAAADTVADDHSLEPTRSLLHRSAASIALQNFDTKTARLYAVRGLQGNPPAEIEIDLRTVFRQTTILDAETRSYALRAPRGLSPIEEEIRGFTKNPPTNIVGLANALGVTVLFLYLGTDAGEIARDIRKGGFSGYSIRVNENDTHVRQRYTIGHELGHFLRHRDRVQNRLRDDKMYRSGHGTTVEKEADALAADLLMPRRIIGDLRKTGVSRVEDLAAKFDVSLEAMQIRLGIRRRQ